MATGKNILCIICDEEIPVERKSDKYCSDECAYIDKQIRERDRNRKKSHSHIILMNDEILHELFTEYGAETYISAKHFIARDFNWQLNRGMKNISGVDAFIMVRYAYTLFNNQTIRIWKL
jgi:predicted nucleic acid-binding Zn ribbon protein